MQNWNLLFRRTHLYLGMLLIPWMLVYALSTVMFNHRDAFRSNHAATPQQWVSLWERDYTVAAPDGNDAVRATAQKILDDNGIKGGFFARRQGDKLNINVQNFWRPKRLTYEFGAKKLRAEERKFEWTELLARLHERTGYGSGGALNNLWAFMVDAYCITSLIWIATGLYLWWKLSATRLWGFAAIGGGMLTIAILLGTL